MEQAKPFFSIIIPTYARPGQLGACLQSLTRIDYPQDRFEVIVVDDGSETPLDEVATMFADRLDIRLVRQAHAGPAAARNAGAAQAQGQFLFFTDDDCAPSPECLKALALRFATTPDSMIGGRTINAVADNIYSTASHLILDMACAYYNADPERARLLTSNNLAVPRERFHAVGGFDPTFPMAAAEDRELCDRWLGHGYKTICAPEVVIYHFHPLSFSSFCRQHFNYGRGAFRFHQARARRGAGRFRPQLRYYLHLLRFLRRSLPQLRAQRALFVGALLLVWQAANAAGFLWEGISQTARRLAR